MSGNQPRARGAIAFDLDLICGGQLREVCSIIDRARDDTGEIMAPTVAARREMVMAQLSGGLSLLKEAMLEIAHLEKELLTGERHVPAKL